MKRTILLLLFLSMMAMLNAQRPSREQMEKDKKAYAEAQRKLNEKLSGMSPEARRQYDSMTNSIGVNQRMNDAMSQVTGKSATAKAGAGADGLVPVKNTKAIAAIAATPSTAAMGGFISTAAGNTFSAILPAANNKANEIYKALKERRASAKEMGKAAAILWMQGRTQIALSLMAQICKADPADTDNLNNYAAMLTMMGAPEAAIPILSNLNTRFKRNSTILNNLGQAWFALGDVDKSKKYLDSTLLIAAAHTQANETLCLIAESKGDKAAALAYGKAAFKQGSIPARRDQLKKLGYVPGANDYTGFPRKDQSDDLLNLGSFSPMEFPKSYAAMKIYEERRKPFLAAIDKATKPLQKLTEESNKETVKRLEAQQKQFMNAMNSTIANPGAVSQSSAMRIVGAPMFSEKMNAKEKAVLQDLQRRKDEILAKMAAFAKGDGAAYRKEYDGKMQRLAERWQNAAGAAATESIGTICIESVKATDAYLKAYNTKYEELYKDYLAVQKQFLNEMAYLSLYTTYPELLPGINAGLKKQWLNDLSFKAEVIGKNYNCADPGDINGGKLTDFKDPNCNIQSEFGQTLGIANLGFKITLNCSGMTTEFNALAVGIKLTQDLDHAGFGDSYKSCTVSIGPKASVGGKVGPLEASVNAGGGIDVEIDKNGGVSDVVVKAGAEIEAGLHNPGITDPGLLGTPASGSVGVEGSVSIITGSGSIKGTGLLGR